MLINFFLHVMLIHYHAGKKIMLHGLSLACLAGNFVLLNYGCMLSFYFCLVSSYSLPYLLLLINAFGHSQSSIKFLFMYQSC